MKHIEKDSLSSCDRISMTTNEAILLELFAIVWVLWVGFMPYEWHGALTFGVVIALAGLVHGFWAEQEAETANLDTNQ